MVLDPNLIEAFVPVGISAIFMGSMAWVTTVWLRVKNGYPLESSWGKPLLPNGGGETMERVKLLAQENAQLRAEVGSMNDRLQVLERIVVDSGTRLANEIDNLPPKALN
jgi:hypothetical protein